MSAKKRLLLEFIILFFVAFFSLQLSYRIGVPPYVIILPSCVLAVIMMLTTVSVVKPDKRFKKKFFALMSIMNDDCDPVRFLEEIQLFMNSDEYRIIYEQYPMYKVDVYFSMADGYACIGNGEKAEEILLEIFPLMEIYNDTNSGHVIQWLLNTRLTLICIDSGKIAAAKEYFEKGKESCSALSTWKRIVAPSPFSKAMNKFDDALQGMFRMFFKDEKNNKALTLNKYNDAIQGMFLIDDKKYDEALTLFKKSLETYERCKREKVEMQYIFSAIYKELGDEENYRNCLSYVAEHGNYLHIAKIAREKLREAK